MSNEFQPPATGGLLPAPPAARAAERQWLIEAAGALGVRLVETQADSLLLLLDELQLANAQFNLTAIRDRPGMLVKHLLDSLSIEPHLSGHRIADVGTGAGFPGLPLAIVNPDRAFTLIEATGKKARFVAHAAKRLGCGNVEVVHARAESYRPQARFDTVVARALASLADFVAYAGHLAAPGGRLLARTGRRPAAAVAARPPGVALGAVHRLMLPGLDDERHLVELSPVQVATGRPRKRPKAASRAP